MTPEQLKASILQYAIQGKLVEQRPEEGTGEELYQQIQAERQRLIQEKKIKKEKPLAEISEDEIPFDIPESWKWCYIGELFLHNTGKAQNSTGSQNGTIRKFITTSNLYWDEFDFTKVKEMPFTDKELERCTVQKGDLLVCEGGDCGRSAVWKYDEEVCIQNHVHRLRPYQPVDIYYFYYLFYFYKNTGKLRGRGVAIQGLSNEAIHRVIVPLPPFAEQKRIVAKIEELLPLADRYAASYEKLEQFNAKFPESMRKSILQYAIQGKLVEQRAGEGTGEELYQQIQVEKQRLIQEKKIKKEKPLAEISEDEIPFDIPKSWKWVRIPEIGTSSLGKTLNKSIDAGKEVPYLCSINVYWEGINLDQVKTAKFSALDMEKYLLQRGSLLICEGGDVGRSAVWDSDTEMYYQNALHCVRFLGGINPYYFRYCFELYKGNKILENASKGMTIKHLVQGSLYSILFPLPPLAEQKRIVAKIEELLPLCDRLRK
ncbi:MAG: restriction endonuclease subunit S [Evtepia gabavorous]|uniref:restriction endonuclease subunit S n=2 Tax=Evtepia gabavorous TaxID=2211183 RepID=UPI002E770231|nr:restriction endonuclease subunit S [Evtepia gabavorous]MEE0066932.1 restriction endonuclease subunit S [Evtepia gabavorous]